jgi:pilus assembly protein CpaB
MRQKLLLVAAVAFGLLAFFLTHQQIELERRKVLGAAQEVNLIEFVKPMARGDMIKSEDIRRLKQKRFKSIRQKEIPWEQRGKILGRTLDVAVERGQTLEWGDLKVSSERKSGLSSIIPMQERALSIPVDAIAAVSHLIQPGDNVDIIGTFRFPEMKGDRALDTVTLTILQYVRVLATGSDYGLITAGEQSTGKRSYSTITVSLTPKEAELIVFAMQKGKLILTLRSQEESAIEKDIQSVNFRFLEQKLESYNLDRERRRHSIRK